MSASIQNKTLSRSDNLYIDPISDSNQQPSNMEQKTNKVARRSIKFKDPLVEGEIDSWYCLATDDLGSETNTIQICGKKIIKPSELWEKEKDTKISKLEEIEDQKELYGIQLTCLNDLYSFLQPGKVLDLLNSISEKLKNLDDVLQKNDEAELEDYSESILNDLEDLERALLRKNLLPNISKNEVIALFHSETTMYSDSNLKKLAEERFR